MSYCRHIVLVVFLFFCAACASTLPGEGRLGSVDDRRVVIVGENIREEIALYYEKKYDALVWFTPFKGHMANTADNLLASGVGSSVARRALIKELKSINNTIGRWEIIIPKIAEKYFLNALKNMKTASLSKARGAVVLIDSNSYPEIERELRRVSDGSLFVTYEFQKDLRL